MSVPGQPTSDGVEGRQKCRGKAVVQDLFVEKGYSEKIFKEREKQEGHTTWMPMPLKRLQCIFTLEPNVPWIDAPVFSAPGPAGRGEHEVASSEPR